MYSACGLKIETQVSWIRSRYEMNTQQYVRNLKCWKIIAMKICSFLPHLLWKISPLIYTCKPTSQWHNWCVYFFSILRSEGQLQLTHTQISTVNAVGGFACSDKAVRNSKWRRVLKLTHLSLYIDTIWIRGSVDPKPVTDWCRRRKLQVLPRIESWISSR
jgi:hypothetical protein